MAEAVGPDRAGGAVPYYVKPPGEGFNPYADFYFSYFNTRAPWVMKVFEERLMQERPQDRSAAMARLAASIAKRKSDSSDARVKFAQEQLKYGSDEQKRRDEIMSSIFLKQMELESAERIAGTRSFTDLEKEATLTPEEMVLVQQAIDAADVEMDPETKQIVIQQNAAQIAEAIDSPAKRAQAARILLTYIQREPGFVDDGGNLTDSGRRAETILKGVLGSAVTQDYEGVRGEGQPQTGMDDIYGRASQFMGWDGTPGTTPPPAAQEQDWDGPWGDLTRLTVSNTADTMGLDNTPSGEDEKALRERTGPMLDEIEKRLGVPVTVNSGFRSDEVDAEVQKGAKKKAKDSRHKAGLALDLEVPEGVSREEFQKVLQDVAGVGSEFIDYDSTTGHMHIALPREQVGDFYEKTTETKEFQSSTTGGDEVAQQMPEDEAMLRQLQQEHGKKKKVDYWEPLGSAQGPEDIMRLFRSEVPDAEGDPRFAGKGKGDFKGYLEGEKGVKFLNPPGSADSQYRRPEGATDPGAAPADPYGESQQPGEVDPYGESESGYSSDVTEATAMPGMAEAVGAAASEMSPDEKVRIKQMVGLQQEYDTAKADYDSYMAGAGASPQGAYGATMLKQRLDQAQSGIDYASRQYDLRYARDRLPGEEQPAPPPPNLGESQQPYDDEMLYEESDPYGESPRDAGLRPSDYSVPPYTGIPDYERKYGPGGSGVPDDRASDSGRRYDHRTSDPGPIYGESDSRGHYISGPDGRRSDSGREFDFRTSDPTPEPMTSEQELLREPDYSVPPYTGIADYTRKYGPGGNGTVFADVRYSENPETGQMERESATGPERYEPGFTPTYAPAGPPRQPIMDLGEEVITGRPPNTGTSEPVEPPTSVPTSGFDPGVPAPKAPPPSGSFEGPNAMDIRAQLPGAPDGRDPMAMLDNMDAETADMLRGPPISPEEAEALKAAMARERAQYAQPPIDVSPPIKEDERARLLREMHAARGRYR
jgi:hypothetical protein